MHFFSKQQLTYFIVLTIFILLSFLTTTSNINDDPTVKQQEITSIKSEETIPGYASIQGAIKNPDIYSIEANTRLSDLINQAGGLIDANSSCINLAQKVFDTQKIYIPHINEPCEPETLVNINTANEEQLQTLPSIGSTRAKDIINYRNTNGPFDTIEKLQEVSGIGPKTFEKLKPLITV